MKRIIIFASGTGSNAESIIRYFSDNKQVDIVAVLSNNKNAEVLNKATLHGIGTYTFNKKAFQSDSFINILKTLNPNLIVLAGFLWKIPIKITKVFEGKIINIHPSLLPKYGGKGMYGIKIHKQVIDHQETETGITIHYVNEHYDDGDIIFQEKIAVDTSDTPEKVAQKINKLEHQHFSKVIEMVL